MRLLLIALFIASCGGASSTCSVAGEHDLTARRVEATTNADGGTCTDLPQTIATHLSLQVDAGHASGTITEGGLAHQVDYSTNVNVCFVNIAWYEQPQPPLVSHSYVLDFGGGYSYLTIARNGVCMARYEFR